MQAGSDREAERAWICCSGSKLRLWRIELDVPEEARRELGRVLSPAERRRAAAFRFDRDRRRFEVARASLRLLLGAQIGVDPADVGIIAGPTGKPSLADPGAKLRFNVSHADEVALVCTSWAIEVGVDVEAMRALPDAVAIAQRYLSPAEAAFVSGGGETAQAERFLACWTRKEAVVKGVGEGLSMPLDSFSVPLCSAVGIVSLANAGRWIVAGFSLGDAHVAAVAAQLPPAAGSAGVHPHGPDPSSDARLGHCRPVDLSAVLRDDSGGCR